MNLFKLASITLSLSIISSVSMAETAPAVDVHTVKVCQRLAKVLKPKGVTPDACYNQAKDYLLGKDIQIMTGSYEAYFALSTGDKTQEPCRTFLKSVVASTQVMELKEAKEIYLDNKAQSLDRAYHSYQVCEDREKNLQAHIKKSPKKKIAKKAKSGKTAAKANTGIQ